jgi:IS30 family transposase
MSYKQLSLADRYYIDVSLQNKLSLESISKNIKRAYTTIKREITRNSIDDKYSYDIAHALSQHRHAIKTKNVKLTSRVKKNIARYLKIDLSPEQICGRFKVKHNISLHHETIYQYVLRDKKEKGLLYKLLRHKTKRYRKRYGAGHNKHGIVNRVDIDERPDEANNRVRVGDFEADTIIGKNHKGAIVTLDDRKSKLRLAIFTDGKKARAVTDGITSLLSPISQFVKTITFDNGKEFSYHEEISEKLSCKAYFAKPYHSWERGQNENANGLLRQYFPKSMELVNISRSQVNFAVDRLNNRPRKCLDYKTPYEVFEELTGISKRDLRKFALIT